MAIIIGTSEANSTFYTEAEAIRTIAKRVGVFDEVNVFATPTASVGNAERLETGEIQFGFMAANWIGRAARGEAPFNRPLGVRMASPANSGPMFFIAQANSGMSRIDEVRGKRISIGPEFGGMAQHVATMFGVLGIGFDEFEVVHFNFADGAAALASGNIDVQFQCPIPNAVMTELADGIDIRVLDYAPGQLDRLIAEVSFYRPAMVRAGALRCHDRDSPQIGVLNVIATHADTPNKSVGALVELMATRHEELAVLNPLFVGLGDLFEPLRGRGAVGLEIDGVVLHPGAVEAYRRCGLIVG